MKLLTGERRGRRIVDRRSGGWCEPCSYLPAAEWHHRVNRSQGGTWSPANGLHVCKPCHDWITLRPLSAMEMGWHLERHEDPAEAKVWLARHGWCLLSPAGDVTLLDLPGRHPW